MILSNLSDKQLVSHYVDGDSQSFEVLIKRHKNKIYGFIFSKIRDRDLAEDIFFP